MVSTELTVIVTDADGHTKTLDSHAPDAADRPRGIQFGSQLGSGFYTGSFTLSRPIDAEHTDLHLGDDVRILLANGETVYEGWISALPRSMDTEHSLTVNLSGYMAHAADEPVSMVFVDRDLGNWRPASASRQHELALGGWKYTGSADVAPDVTDATASLKLSLNRVTNDATGHGEKTEVWYDIGSGQTIGRFYRDFVTFDKGDAGKVLANVDWQNKTASLANDDALAGDFTDYGRLGAGPGAGYQTVTGPHRFLLAQLWLNTASADVEGQWETSLRRVAVYGSHGLPLVGDTDPKGVAASDVIRWLIANYCPHLNADGVQSTTYPISHLIADETTPYDLMLKVNSFHLWDLACWENRTIHFKQTDLSDWQWQIRHDEVGNQMGLQGDEFTDLVAGVQVKYQDVATGTQERLHPNDYPLLRDASISNPANIHGRRKYPTFDIPFPTTAANALELGRIKLAELSQVKAPGSFTVTGQIRDRAGQLQPVSRVRSGDVIRLTSSASLNDGPRLIHECSYSHDGSSVTISVDSTRTVIEALLDRTTTALQSAGLS